LNLPEHRPDYSADDRHIWPDPDRPAIRKKARNTHDHLLILSAPHLAPAGSPALHSGRRNVRSF
jgi:hypothetical protein